MRIVVLLLVASNTVLLLWALLRPDAPEPEAPAESPLPVGVERLVLLAELEGRASEVRRTSPRTAAVCVRAGPLQNEIDARAVVTRARSLGFAAELKALDVVAGLPDLQVHLPPLPSAEQASRAVRELAALGIEAYVIPDGTHAGAVSVGMFTDEAPARARREAVAALGYPVRIVELPRTRRLWDVSLEGIDLNALDTFLLGLREDWPELSGDRVPCPEVPAGDIPRAGGLGAG